MNGTGWLCAILLKRLPDIAIAEYRESNSPAVGSSFWYSQLIEFLNDTFPDDDGVWLNFEGPLSEFLLTLLDFEAKGFQGAWRFVRLSCFLAGSPSRSVTAICGTLPCRERDGEPSINS